MFTISVDTGGTFTDVVLADPNGHLQIAKALTTRDRAYQAISSALDVIAVRLGTNRHSLLANTVRLNYGTTRATNAVVESKAARTAFFTTAGFPDILLLREGGKPDPFRSIPYGRPYVPRYLTFEIEERVDAEASIFRPLNEQSVVDAIQGAIAQGAEAIGVCLIWAVANPVHELRIGELIAQHAPEVPFTLSHQLNPVIREYRRASATVIDASLKPLMQEFCKILDQDLSTDGFRGNLFISTSYGGSWSTKDISERPIYSIGSGPSMAPVSAVREADRDLPGGALACDLLVADMGGTTFDVALVRSGEVEFTNETWLGGRWIGNITGTRAVDIKSIGAGGGSIAWIDSGGLLKVGPNSAGSSPGPACYGKGGLDPTVTDAALILGYLESSNFMDGTLRLNVGASRKAFEHVAEMLGMNIEEVAYATMTIASDNVATAIRQITVARGIDPRESIIVAGGGASGMNIGRIAAELGTRSVLIPRTAGAMSAFGALFADIIHEFTCVKYVETAKFDVEAANAALHQVRVAAEEFLAQLAPDLSEEQTVTYTSETRYRQQVWELSLPLLGSVVTNEDAEVLEQAFHVLHERVFGVQEPGQSLEILAWTARAKARLAHPVSALSDEFRTNLPERDHITTAHFGRRAGEPTDVYWGPGLPLGAFLSGPAVVQEPTTTIVVYPGHTIVVLPSGNYLMEASNVDR